jgi:hypothetical protein
MTGRAREQRTRMLRARPVDHVLSAVTSPAAAVG